MFQIIPAIDILNGEVVRLTKGDYGTAQTYPHKPDDLARFYQDHNFKRIHLVDLDGAKAGKLVNQNVIQKIRGAVQIELDLGGGIRTAETVTQLFDLGINYAVLGSMLIKNTQQALDIIDAFPNQIIAGIDLKNNQIAIEGWTEQAQISTLELLHLLQTYKIREIIYTDIERDGTLSGPHIEGLKEFSSWTHFPIIASGGIGSMEDIQKLRELESLGISGCIVGKALLQGKIIL